MMDRNVKWETMDDYLEHYHKMMEAVCYSTVDDKEDMIKEMCFSLWNNVRTWANRNPTNLLFDCVYIIGNATGNKISVPFLTYISQQVLQKTVIPMRTKTEKQRWFITERGREAIMGAMGYQPENGLEEGYQELYLEVVSRWIEEEE